MSQNLYSDIYLTMHLAIINWHIVLATFFLKLKTLIKFKSIGREKNILNILIESKVTENVGRRPYSVVPFVLYAMIIATSIEILKVSHRMWEIEKNETLSDYIVQNSFKLLNPKVNDHQLSIIKS